MAQSIKEREGSLSENIPTPNYEEIRSNLVGQIENEYNPTNPVQLPLLRSVEGIYIKEALKETEDEWREHEVNRIKEKEYDKTYQNLFNYLAATRDLEVDSQRTQKIQTEVLDKMVPEGLKTRVVILRKGLAKEGFVTPDGTIFLSQSLINAVDSYDELAAVIGHEVSHLIFKSSLTISSSNDFNILGVRWVHEASCDQGAVGLLEKAGFKATAFATAIEKIQGIERGIVHQSGMMRATQSYAGLGVLDRNTSSNGLKHLPPDFKLPARETNLEIIAKIPGFYDLSSDQVESVAAKLHPKDLGIYYRLVVEDRLLRYDNNKEAEYSRIVKPLDRAVAQRLSEKGYTQEEINVFLLLQKPHKNRQDAYFLKDPQDFVKTCAALIKFDTSDFVNTISNDVFDQDDPEYIRQNKNKDFGDPKYKFDAIKDFFEHLYNDFYDINSEPNSLGIPITRDSLIQGLKYVARFSKNDDDRKRFDTPSGSAEINKLLGTYIAREFILQKIAKNEEIDIEEIKSFLQRLNEEDIYIYSHNIRDQIVNSLSTLREISNGALYSRNTFNGKEVLVSQEKRKEAHKIITDILEIKEHKEEKREFGDFRIEQLFTDLEDPNILLTQKTKQLSTFLWDMKTYFRENKSDDQTIKFFADLLLERLFVSSINTNFNISEFLKNPLVSQARTEERDVYTSSNRKRPTKKEYENNQKYLKFYLGSLLGASAFETDGEDFYSYFDNLINKSQIDFGQLSKEEIINLCNNVLLAQSDWGNRQSLYFGDNQVAFFEPPLLRQIKNYDKFFDLPFMIELSQRDDSISADTFKQLVKKKEYFMEKLIVLRRDRRFREFDLFGDDLLYLIIGKQLREEALTLLEGDIAEEDLLHLSKFIDTNYIGIDKPYFLREINKRYLSSATISLDKKVEYLLTNIELLGVEGFMMVAEQITDIKDFRKLKKRLGKRFEEYISGETSTTIEAGADYITSFFSGKFSDVFNTAIATEQNKQDVSTKMALKWFDKVSQDLGFSFSWKKEKVYDLEQRKFLLGRSKRDRFRSLRDIFQNLEDVSSTKRMLMALKLLVDREGGLTTPKAREEVSKIVINALNLDDDFLKAVLSAATREADAKLIAFPIAQVIGPLLFRAFDTNKVDIAQVANHPLEYDYDYSDENEAKTTLKDRIPVLDIPYILSSHTRDIKIFGQDFAPYLDSDAFKLAKESDLQYEAFNNRLKEIFGERDDQKSKLEIESGLDISIEALIKAVETSGALGVRALQLTTQFEQLPPLLEKRLSQSFDSNHGMEKLRFWMNLDKIASENPDIKDFVSKIQLGSYLGGGSLQTTYQARYTSGDGVESDVVLKLKNPNVELFVDEVYDSSYKTLEAVIRDSTDPRSINFAKTGMMLLDLSKEWCKADIRTQGYEVLDDQFKSTILSFNQAGGNSMFYAPDRVLTHLKLKVETLGTGKTVNQFLNDGLAGNEAKRQAVTSLSKFFLHQLNHPTFTNQAGKEVFVLGSDPHLGNFLIDREGNIGVIDRDYYLQLERADVEVIKKLIYESNPRDFASAFVDRLLDVNKVRGLQKTISKGKILGKLSMQFAKGERDNMRLLRTLLTEFSNEGMSVPVEMRIMIRNAEAFKKLASRYGLELRQINK